MPKDKKNIDDQLEEEMTNPLNCPLYSKCNSMYSSHQLLADEVTQIKISEEKATKDRREAKKEIIGIRTDLNNHTRDFKQVVDFIDELKLIIQKIPALQNNQKWMQVIAYVFGGGITVALLWLFAHANITDKDGSAINETLKNNTKAIEKQNEYMRETVKELRTLNGKNIEAIVELKTKVNQIEINQNRNYGQIQGLKSR